MIELLNGDCLEVMPMLEPGSIDLVLTDPPYGTTACKWDSVIPLDRMWAELKRITKARTAIVLMANQPFTTTVISSNFGMFKYCWVWEKNLKSGHLNIRRRPMGGYEDVVVFGEKPPTYNPQKRKRTSERKAGTTKHAATSVYGKQSKDFVHNQSNLLHPDTILKGIKCVHNGKRKVHPTQKPVALMEYLIETYTNEGDTVLDFAMGSGTTGVACKNLNRNFIGIELDEKYFEIAKERLNQIRSNA